MRTPLNGIQGHASLLAQYLGALQKQQIQPIKVNSLGDVEVSVEDASEMIKAIQQAAQGLFTLINEVLEKTDKTSTE